MDEACEELKCSSAKIRKYIKLNQSFDDKYYISRTDYLNII